MQLGKEESSRVRLEPMPLLSQSRDRLSRWLHPFPLSVSIRRPRHSVLMAFSSLVSYDLHSWALVSVCSRSLSLSSHVLRGLEEPGQVKCFAEWQSPTLAPNGKRMSTRYLESGDRKGTAALRATLPASHFLALTTTCSFAEPAATTSLFLPLVRSAILKPPLGVRDVWS